MSIGLEPIGYEPIAGQGFRLAPINGVAAEEGESVNADTEHTNIRSEQEYGILSASYEPAELIASVEDVSLDASQEDVV